MNIKIEELKKSERGIEVTGWVEFPYREAVTLPYIPAGTSIEKKELALRPYYTSLKEANHHYEDATAEFERLHLGEAALIQEKAKGEVKENGKSID